MNELFKDEIVALVVFVFGYLVYYFSYENEGVKRLAYRIGDNPNREEFAIHIPRIIGFITLGLIPCLLIFFSFDHPLTDYGFQIPNGRYTILISLGLTLTAILVSVYRPGKGMKTDFYPQVRLDTWTKQDHFRNTLSWCLYLLGYEFMLRGVLFFTTLFAFGLVPAVVINSVIYSLIHIYKGKGEAFGAFFFGILLCLVAYQTSSFIIPYVIHVILAIGNDRKALQASKSSH